VVDTYYCRACDVEYDRYDSGHDKCAADTKNYGPPDLVYPAQPDATEPNGNYACADMNGPVVTDRQAAVMWMKRAESAEAQLAAVRNLPRWTPCEVEAEEGDPDGPVFQGFLTDTAGAWIRVEDLERALNKPTPGAGTGEPR
jgi:hypothetical protein